METRIKEKGERFKELAEIFLKLDKRVYIKDSDNNIYFADLLLVGDDSILIQCFAPKQRVGEKITLYWPLVVSLEEYKEEKQL